MSRNTRSEFQELTDTILNPTLTTLEFQEVKLKGCIHPEVLFNRDRLWFGASWDRRDRFLEVELGHLYWFQDVMPRVVILGPYSSYCPEQRSFDSGVPGYLRQVTEFLRGTIESAIAICEKRYEQILAEQMNAKKGKYRKEFFTHLGKEVSKSDLQKFLS